MASKDCIQKVADAAGIDLEGATEILEDATAFVRLDIGDDAIRNAKSYEAYREGKWKAIADKETVAILKARNAALNRTAEERGSRFVDTYLKSVEKENGKPPKAKDYREAIITMMAGTNEEGHVLGADFSSDAIGKQTFVEYGTDLMRELSVLPKVMERLGHIGTIKQSGKAMLFGSSGDAKFQEDVVRVMFGEVVDDDIAMQSGAILNKHMWKWGSDVNRVGGVIPLKKNKVPQSHNKTAMVDAGKEKWVNTIIDNDLVDELTFDKRPKSQRRKSIPIEEKKRSLGEMYDDILYGQRHGEDTLDNAFAFAGSAASSLEQHRVIHFRNADSFLMYRNLFGDDDLMSSVMYNARERANRVGLMQTFGPNPEQTIDNIVGKMKDNVRDSSMSEKDKTRIYSTLSGERSLRSGKIWRMYSVVSGEVDMVEDVVVSNVFKTVRDIHTLSKLGSAALSAVADAPNFQNAVRNVRGDFLGYADYAKGMLTKFGEGEAREIILQAGDFMEGINTFHVNRFDAGDVATGRMGAAADVMFRATGLNHLTNAGKAAYSYMLQSTLGRWSSKNYGDLFIGMQQELRRYGITEDHWNVLREARYKGNKQDFVTPTAVREVSLNKFEKLVDEKYHLGNAPVGKEKEEWLRVRKGLLMREKKILEQRYRSAIIGGARRAILEPDARTKQASTLGKKRGGFFGEAMRLVTQFKSFPIAFTQSRNPFKKEGRYRMLGIVPNAGIASNTAGAVQAITSYLMFGYLATTLKDLAAGRSPKDISKPETIASVMMQSGGAGIWGDIIFNAESLYGIESLAGPTVGAGAQIGRAGIGFVREGLEAMQSGKYDQKAMDKALRNIARTAGSTVPFANMWMFKAGIDYGLSANIYEALDRGYNRRKERRVKKKYGQEYYFPPSKYRLGK